MPDETDEIVGSLGRELVSQLVPEELPLYPSMLSQFQGARRGRGRKASSDDQLLGFGAAEALTMLTPVILSFTRSFWKALVAQAAQDSVQGVLEYVKAHLPGHHEAAAGRRLTPASSSSSGRWLSARPAGWTYPRGRQGFSPMRWWGS